MGLVRVNKRAYLDKLTPSQLKEAYLNNEKNKNINMPFSPIISSREGKLIPFKTKLGSSNSAIRISWNQSDGSSDIKFTYSKNKNIELVGTPKFTDTPTPIKTLKNSSEFWTPKCEPAVYPSVNPSSGKSQLNTDYLQISKKVSVKIL